MEAMSIPRDTTFLYHWQQDFLALLRQHGYVTLACKQAKIDRRWVYTVRDKDPIFAAAWDQVIKGVKRAQRQSIAREEDDNVSAWRTDSDCRYVYMIRESWRGLIKIGIAKNLKARLAAIQSSCPQDICLIGYFETKHARSVEAHLHQRFAHKHHAGEWFDLSPQDVQLILDYHDGFVLIDMQGEKVTVG